jgi:hypothetical protein
MGLIVLNRLILFTTYNPVLSHLRQYPKIINRSHLSVKLTMAQSLSCILSSKLKPDIETQLKQIGL